MEDSRSTKFVQKGDHRLTFDIFYDKVKFASLYIYMGKMLISHILKMY